MNDEKFAKLIEAVQSMSEYDAVCLEAFIAGLHVGMQMSSRETEAEQESQSNANRKET